MKISLCLKIKIAAIAALSGLSVNAVAADCDVAAKRQEPMRVVLTFDDSLKDHLLIAAPMLEERGWRGVFDIVTDWVGKDERHLTWDDVRELLRRGHEVATHTVSHPHLLSLLKAGETNEVRRQFAASRDIIFENTGFAPRYMCSPYGQQDEETARLCREAGLEPMSVRRVGFGGSNHGRTDEFIGSLIAKGCARADLLHHGVSAEDHGGWDSFSNAVKFAEHLDRIAALEKSGKICVTDYDGVRSSCRLRASAWPRHGVVALSFDDHNIDSWRKAFPIFEKYGATVTFFIFGDIGAEEIRFAREAMSLGHEIGLHGARHRDADTSIEKMGGDKYWKAELEPQLVQLSAAGIRPRSFAYPNCRRNAEADALLASRGFMRLRGRLDGVASPNPYDPKGEKLDKWRRVCETDAVFAPAADYLRMLVIGNVIIGTAYHTDMDDILASMRRSGERAELLSLVSHAIAPGAVGISMPTEWLERILAAADDAGVVVRGVR